MPKRPRRKMGGSLKSVLNTANNFLKKTKAISKVSSALSGIVPYADKVATASSKLGYGKRRSKRGRGKGPVFK